MDFAENEGFFSFGTKDDEQRGAGVTPSPASSQTPLICSPCYDPFMGQEGNKNQNPAGGTRGWRWERRRWNPKSGMQAAIQRLWRPFWEGLKGLLGFGADFTSPKLLHAWGRPRFSWGRPRFSWALGVEPPMSRGGWGHGSKERPRGAEQGDPCGATSHPFLSLIPGNLGGLGPMGPPQEGFFCWKKELGLGVGPTGELQTSGSVEADSGKAPEPLPGCSGFIGRPRPLPRAPAAFLGLTISRHPRLGMGQGWGMGWERRCSSRCPPMEIPRIFRDGRTHWGLGNPGVLWGAGTKPPPRHPEPGFREN